MIYTYFIRPVFAKGSILSLKSLAPMIFIYKKNRARSVLTDKISK